jgi:putative Holliday junction resolvase
VVSRVLGIDLGSQRVGLAVADASVGIARPLATIARGGSLDADAHAIGRVCREQGVVELVVGLPMHAGGAEGEMATTARSWASALGEALGLPVTMRDERLSSFEAERRLGRMPRGRSGGPPTKTQRTAFRARIDREAASVILQDELDARRGAIGASAVRPVPPASAVPDGDPEETR